MGFTTTYISRKTVGKRLQQLRKEAGFSSAKKFAEYVGFNPNTYTQYEQGITGFNYEQAWILADALGCTMDQLGGREWPPGGQRSPVLAPDEAALMGDYRKLKPRQKNLVREQASTMADDGDA